jgi:hypothetical protein
MNKSEVAAKVGITASRLKTIAVNLLGEDKNEFTAEEFAKVQGIVEIIRANNDASVKKAVLLYNQGLTAESQRVDPRSKISAVEPIGNRTSGLNASQQDAQQIAQLLAERQVSAILELKDNYVADWLVNGIPIDVISSQSVERLENSSDRLYAATLGNIDAAGNYLPALVQNSGRMLSAAIDE